MSWPVIRTRLSPSRCLTFREQLFFLSVVLRMDSANSSSHSEGTHQECATQPALCPMITQTRKEMCPHTLSAPTFPVTPGHALGETQSIGNILFSESMGSQQLGPMAHGNMWREPRLSWLGHLLILTMLRGAQDEEREISSFTHQGTLTSSQ